jgi:DNA primase
MNKNNNLPSAINAWLTEKRGLSDTTIQKFGLGWDGTAITIPIHDRNGEIAFYKYRKDPYDNSDRPKYWCSDGSSAQLYGWEHILDPKSQLVICEGELDRLILEEHGIPAITSTAGARTFNDEWISMLKELPSRIIICYDIDEAGAMGTERIAKELPEALIVRLPSEDGVKDITDYITKYGIAKLNEWLNSGETLTALTRKTLIAERSMKRKLYPRMSLESLLQVLGLTVKEDNANKLITFLCFLSAYTEDEQFNISFNAPSSTGKSYIPLEIVALFPEEDTRINGYCSPTAFFHDAGQYDKEHNVTRVDLSRKIIVFLDQPHTLLLQHLRPLLSHDRKEIAVKITDKKKAIGMRTKNVQMIGFPSVVFCSAGLMIDEQEATRFLLLSPELTQEKLRKSVLERLYREADSKAYREKLKQHPDRKALMERIRAIKEEGITNVVLKEPEIAKIQQLFLSEGKIIKPRDSRDIKRVIAISKAFTLLNLYNRDFEDDFTAIASKEDVDHGMKIWQEISKSQALNLPPYAYKIYEEIISPLCLENKTAVTRRQVIEKHHEVYGRPLSEWQLRREILPLLEMADLIVQELDPHDKRRTVIYLVKVEDQVDETV